MRCDAVIVDDRACALSSMLSAAGGIDDGGVDEQVLNVFVGHYEADGSVSYDTTFGAYGIRLFKHGQWHPVVIDDFFPVLVDSLWTTENR